MYKRQAEAEAAKSECLAAVTAAVQTDALARAREEGRVSMPDGRACPAEPFEIGVGIEGFDVLRATGDWEYELNINGKSLSGEWTLAAWVKIDDEWDGTNNDWGIFHARFDPSGNRRSTGGGALPSRRNVWERLTQTFPADGAQTTAIRWHLGYNAKSTKGYIYVWGISVTAPDGTELVPDGDFPGGAHPSTYRAGLSYGTFALINECSYLGVLPPETYPGSTSDSPTVDVRSETPTLVSTTDREHDVHAPAGCSYRADSKRAVWNDMGERTMCPATHPWLYRPLRGSDACCATAHANNNQYFRNSRPDLSTRGDNCIGGYAWCPTRGQSIPCIDYAESTDGLPPTMVTTAGVAAPKFWQVVPNKFCGNRPCSDGACAHSIKAKSAADLSLIHI